MTPNTSELQQLAQDFWTWRAANQPISSDDIPRIERPADWTPDWSQKAFARRSEELTDFTRRHEEINSHSWPVPQQVRRGLGTWGQASDLAIRTARAGIAS